MTTTKPSKQHACCGVTETISEAKYNARQRRNAKPQPWVVLKLMVLVTFAIMCYAFYVFVHKLVVPMLRRQPDAVGSFGAAIGILVVFSLFWLWMVWAYVRVVVTSPGEAPSFVKPSAPPIPRAQQDPGNNPNYYPLDPAVAARPSYSTTQAHTDTIGGPSYEEMRASDLNSHDHHGSQSQLTQPISQDTPKPQNAAPASDEEELQAGVLNALPNPAPTIGSHPGNPVSIPQRTQPQSETNDNAPHASTMPISETKKPQFSFGAQRKAKISRQDSVRSQISRIPSSIPVLLPERRYCSKCSIVKPFRAHHCRSCGTCILKYDHHCPWIGQCVGARNHKFFLNFTLAAAVFTLYTFIILLAFNLSAQNSGARFAGDWDPQVIVILAIAALFCVFTTSLTLSHVWLILLGQSTVESMHFADLKEEENERLNMAFGFLNMSAKRKKRAEWDRIWGRPQYEGNIWWLGSARKEWETVMGKNPWGWIFPVGHSLTDGLSYPVNPRFDEEGRWRPRSQWPAELQ